MKQPKCPNCGSKNVILSTDLEDVQFYIDDKGNIDFEIIDVRDQFEHCLKYSACLCECEDCGENWDYED